jgi:bifunctional non-homologous end joining protein LigD
VSAGNLGFLAKRGGDDKLATYRAKRDFGGTPEPAGSTDVAEPDLPRFVVQEHHATALHWDLRLERDGVLVSWAVPKGIPPDPKTNHLAVHTEDHPMEYLTFGGTIPEGNYGAGTMGIWDTGTYEPIKWDEREVKVVFHGGRVSGQYVLFRTGGNQWMIHRMDPPADPDRVPFPGWPAFAPMLMTEGPMPDRRHLKDFAFEIGWGGHRVVTHVEGGRVRIRGSASKAKLGDTELIGVVPELRALGLALGTVEVVLDGELIVPGDGGRPDSEGLAKRLGAQSPNTARRLSRSHPVAFMIFDLLWQEGHPTVDRPFQERRQRLEDLSLGGPSWQVPPSAPGEGPALLEAATAQGLPAVVAKRQDRPYRSGPAKGDWIRVATGA